MPVDADRFDRGGVTAPQLAAERESGERRQRNQPDEDMQAVESGQREEGCAEQVAADRDVAADEPEILARLPE